MYLEKTDCPGRSFPDLTFIFTRASDDATLKFPVPAASFLRQNGENCDILVRKGSATFELGNPFLVNYYLILDGANQQVGMLLSETN